MRTALEKIGFGPCYHMTEVFKHPEHAEFWNRVTRGEKPAWEDLFAGYSAAVDWPSCNFWASQLAAYPGAKVILSERDPERWYDSVMNTIYGSTVAALRDAPDSEQAPLFRMVDTVIWKGVFSDRMHDKDHVITCYLEHNERVRQGVPSHRLLVFDPSEGWGPLCSYLDMPVPEDPFPHENTTAEFRARAHASN